MTMKRDSSLNATCGLPLQDSVSPTAIEGQNNEPQVGLDENNNPIEKQPGTAKNTRQRAHKRRELVDKENIVGDLDTMCTRRSSKRLKKPETFDGTENKRVLRVKVNRCQSEHVYKRSFSIDDQSLVHKHEQTTPEKEDILTSPGASQVLKNLVTNQLSEEVTLPVCEQELSKQMKQGTTTENVPASLINIGLNMSCHSDTSYNFEDMDPFSALTEELDENNNLVMRHQKLQTFVVTSNLNEKLNGTMVKKEKPQEDTNRNLQEVMDEINMLKNEKRMNFNGIEPDVELDQSNYNFKFFRGILSPDMDEFGGLSACHEGVIAFENVQSPMLAIEEQALLLEQQELLEEQKSSEQNSIKETESELKVVVKNESINLKKTQTNLLNNRKSNAKYQEQEIDYALRKALKIFSSDELTNGIFCDLNKKGEQINRSKSRIPLDEAKTYQLKEEIRNKFQMSYETLEKAWKFIKTDLNKLLSRKSNRF